MSEPTRAATIHAMLAQGLSRRAIAASLEISEKTVRRTLGAAPEPVAAPKPLDFIAPEDRVALTATRDQLLFEGGAVHPRKAWISCSCGAPAFRIASGIDEWQCSAPVGPRGPHGPRQVADADGTPQIRYGPYRIRPFPGGAA